MQNPNKITVVRCAIVSEDNTILTVQRSDGKNPKTSHKWELPGGQLDYGETREEALVREVGQETGFEIELTTPFKQFDSYVISDGERAGTTYKAFVCRAIAVGGKQHLSKEHIAIAQQNLDQIQQSPDFRADTQPALRKLF